MITCLKKGYHERHSLRNSPYFFRENLVMAGNENRANVQIIDELSLVYALSLTYIHIYIRKYVYVITAYDIKIISRKGKTRIKVIHTTG